MLRLVALLLITLTLSDAALAVRIRGCDLSTFLMKLVTYVPEHGVATRSDILDLLPDFVHIAKAFQLPTVAATHPEYFEGFAKQGPNAAGDLQLRYIFDQEPLLIFMPETKDPLAARSVVKGFLLYHETVSQTPEAHDIYSPMIGFQSSLRPEIEHGVGIPKGRDAVIMNLRPETTKFFAEALMQLSSRDPLAPADLNSYVRTEVGPNAQRLKWHVLPEYNRDGHLLVGTYSAPEFTVVVFQGKNLIIEVTSMKDSQTADALLSTALGDLGGNRSVTHSAKEAQFARSNQGFDNMRVMHILDGVMGRLLPQG